MIDSKWSTRLDGSVGEPDSVEKGPSSMRLPDLPVQVSIRSDVASEMRILSLEDDLTRLVEVFLKHPSSVSKETRTDTSSDSEPDQDIEVTIHLKLAEDAKAHLVEQIKLFVRTLFAEETQT